MSLGDSSLDPHYAQAFGPPRLRFDAIGEAVQLFRREVGTWLAAGLVALLINVALESLLHSTLGRGMFIRGDGFQIALPPRGGLIAFVVSSISNGFILGGMIRMACLQVRGRPIAVHEMFGVFDVAKELAIGLALYALACFVGAACFVFPAFVAAGVLMLTIPLVVDARLKGVEAVRGSWDALKGLWLAATVFHSLVYVLGVAGAFACGVGLMVTMPLYCLSIAVLYRDLLLIKPPAGFEKPVAPDPDF